MEDSDRHWERNSVPHFVGFLNILLPRQTIVFTHAPSLGPFLEEMSEHLRRIMGHLIEGGSTAEQREQQLTVSLHLAAAASSMPLSKSPSMKALEDITISLLLQYYEKLRQVYHAIHRADFQHQLEFSPGRHEIMEGISNGAKGDSGFTSGVAVEDPIVLRHERPFIWSMPGQQSPEESSIRIAGVLYGAMTRRILDRRCLSARCRMYLLALSLYVCARSLICCN